MFFFLYSAYNVLSSFMILLQWLSVIKSTSCWESAFHKRSMWLLNSQTLRANEQNNTNPLEKLIFCNKNNAIFQSICSFVVNLKVFFFPEIMQKESTRYCINYCKLQWSWKQRLQKLNHFTNYRSVSYLVTLNYKNNIQRKTSTFRRINCLYNVSPVVKFMRSSLSFLAVPREAE